MSCLLTIAIPTYNRSDLCLEQVQRVASWSFKYSRSNCVEIIVLDNASTERCDHLKAVCSKLNVNYHYSYNNTGSSGNFCRAWQAGTSDFLWILSDDDIVTDEFFELVFHYINSDHPPYLLGVSCEMSKPFIAGKAKDVFRGLLQGNMLAITSLTLVSSTIFRRSLFNCAAFWQYEPWWFPHSFCIYKEAVSSNVDCVLIRGGKGTLYESGNTVKERQVSPHSTITQKALSNQFQTALLEFINVFPVQCGLSPITEDQYIQEVVKRFSCPPAAIRAGMSPIHSYSSFNLDLL